MKAINKILLRYRAKRKCPKKRLLKKLFKAVGGNIYMFMFLSTARKDGLQTISCDDFTGAIGFHDNAMEIINKER